MAVRKSTRSAGPKGPFGGGNRIRTHPSGGSAIPERKTPSRRAHAKRSTKSRKVESRRKPGRRNPSKPRRAVDVAPASELRYIRGRLTIASAIARICAAALEAQAVELAPEIDLALRWGACNEIFSQTSRIGRLLDRKSVV